MLAEQSTTLYQRIELPQGHSAFSIVVHTVRFLVSSFVVVGILSNLLLLLTCRVIPMPLQPTLVATIDQQF